MEAFDTLQKQTDVKLEDSFLTQLHKVLVQDGNFQKCEELIEAAAAGEFLFGNNSVKYFYFGQICSFQIICFLLSLVSSNINQFGNK